MRLEFLGGPVKGLHCESKSNADPYLNQIMEDTNSHFYTSFRMQGAKISVTSQDNHFLFAASDLKKK